MHPGYTRWPDWAYPPPAAGLEALRSGGLYVSIPANPAPGDVLSVATLIQRDGDVTTWWNAELSVDWRAPYALVVRQTVAELQPFRGAWQGLTGLLWAGPAIEGGLVTWSLLTESPAPDRWVELLWQSGWLGAATGLSALGWVGRWWLRRRIRALLRG